MVVKDKIFYCKILDAKDLYPPNIKQADTYCNVEIEGGEDRKTPTIWNDIAPYFGEEIVIDNHLPPELKKVTVQIFQDTKGVGRSLGKIILPRDNLEDNTLEQEQWYSVQQYIEEKIYGDIKLDAEFINGGTSIKITNIECRDLDQQIIDDISSGNIQVVIAIDLFPDNEGINVHTSKMLVNQSGALSATTVITLPVNNVATQVLHFSLWVGSPYERFLGHCTVPLSAPTCPIKTPGERWYSLQNRLFNLNRPVKKWNIKPKDNLELHKLIKNIHSIPPPVGKAKKVSHKLKAHVAESSTLFCKHCGMANFPKVPASICTTCKCIYHNHCSKFATQDCTTTPAIRLKVNYTSSTILPLQNYNPFLDLLAEKNYLLPHVFGKCSAKDKVMAATSFIKLEESRDKVTDFLTAVITREINDTPTAETLFRGNSMASKAVDSYMKHLGLPYLKKALGDIIKSISSKRISCELDSTNMLPDEDVGKNIKMLSELSTKIFDAIYETRYQIPVAWKPIFAHIQTEVVKKFPNSEQVKYTSVSGFLFLRFFAPAVLGPRLFGLLSEYVPPKTARTFTLLAKVLQSLSNLVLFGQKEPYMMPMNAFIESHTLKLKDYIDTISMPISLPKTVSMHYIDYETAREAARLFHVYIKTTPEILKTLKPEDSELGLKLARVLTRLTVETTAADVQSSSNPYEFPSIKKSYASFIKLGVDDGEDNEDDLSNGLPASNSDQPKTKKKKGTKKKKAKRNIETNEILEEVEENERELDITNNNKNGNIPVFDFEPQNNNIDTLTEQLDDNLEISTQSDDPETSPTSNKNIDSIGNLHNVLNLIVHSKDSQNNRKTDTQANQEKYEKVKDHYLKQNPKLKIDLVGNILNMTCSACSGLLNILSNPVILEGLGWHLEHFVCIRCRIPVGLNNSALVDGVLYCSNHIDRSSCNKCGLTLKDQVCSVGELDFHPDCFVCAACGVSIKNGFIPYDNNVYCRDDYYKLVGLICSVCKTPTDTDFIEIGTEKFHIHCRSCDQCGQSLANKGYALVGNEIYCEDHFETN